MRIILRKLRLMDPVDDLCEISNDIVGLYDIKILLIWLVTQARHTGIDILHSFVSKFSLISSVRRSPRYIRQAYRKGLPA